MNTLRRIRHDRLVSINSKVGRDLNRSMVLNLIREGQPISRARIAQVSRLNKSTVSSIVSGLLMEDLVVEENNLRQSVGRTPINLRVKTGKHYVGAIAVDSSKTVLAVVDIDGTIKASEEMVTESKHPLAFVSRCINAVESLRKRLRLPQLRGIGLTIAGIVDPQQLNVVYAPNLGWEDVDLRSAQAAHALYADAITIENDAKASALAELWFGRHTPAPANFVFLSVGAGIGTGIVINNRILGGNSHAAGEFGHMTIVEGGEPCTCGNRGCWEAYASDRATARRYAANREPGAGETPRMRMAEIVASALEGDTSARSALLRSAHYLGLGTTNIVRAFDPELIVIGGTITRAWELVYPEIVETIKTSGFGTRQHEPRILPSSLSSSPALLGAAALSIRKIFTDFRIAI